MAADNQQQTFLIGGMDCASCARSVEQGVAQLAGVRSCELNFTTERLHIEGTVASAVVVQRVRDLGYTATALGDAHDTPPVPRVAPQGFLAFLWARLTTRLALIGVIFILPGLVFHELFHYSGELAWLIEISSFVALLVAGLPVAQSAWRSLSINRELNINVLMTIAAIGALVIGATTEAGMVMVLFAIGEALEGYTASRARHSIRSLMEIAPATATLLRQHEQHVHEERVAVAALQIGDRILVLPGERIAVDGRVLAGESAVNQAPITGESRLIEKQPGAELFAGSMNGEGSLEVEVTHLAADSTISRMIKLVEEAQERRAPVERMVDQFARWYTPAVVAIALLVASIPPLFFGQPFWNPAPDEFGWFYRALTLLVVACPCALVISTPVSLISALSVAARSGILIKGGSYLEALSRVKAVAFDKTGTLTLGQPTLVGVRSAACLAGSGSVGDCAACDDLLALAHALERRSEHPLAQAISSASSTRGLDQRYAATNVTALVGRGVQGSVDGHEILIGSHTYFDSAIPHAPADCAQAVQDAQAGYTPVFVSADGTYRGTLTVADRVRSSSQAAIAALTTLGVQSAILTGDAQATASRIAHEIGVGDVRAELLPAQKVGAIEDLRRQYGAVAMVGDGINDAPALAAANVGIAIGAGHGGTSQAMETADITLLSDDLQRLPFAIRLSRAALRTVRFNIAFSIAIKLIFLALVVLGMGTMWMAVLADVGTSLLVTLNGMRLLRYSERTSHR